MYCIYHSSPNVCISEPSPTDSSPQTSSAQRRAQRRLTREDNRYHSGMENSDTDIRNRKKAMIRNRYQIPCLAQTGKNTNTKDGIKYTTSRKPRGQLFPSPSKWPSGHRIGGSRELSRESSNADRYALKQRFRLQIGDLKWQFAIENAIFNHFRSVLVDFCNSLRLPHRSSVIRLS